MAAVALRRHFLAVLLLQPEGPIPYEAVVMGACALLAGAKSWYRFRQARRARLWRPVNGVILHSRIDSRIQGSRNRERTEYRPDLVFAYRAQGKDYTGTRALYGSDRWSSSDEVVKSLFDKYREGAAVTVFVDPFNPSVAMLEPRHDGYARGERRYALAFAGIAIIYLVFGRHLPNML